MTTKEFGVIGEPAVEPLIGYLSDTDPNIRASACEGLGFIGDRRAIPPIIDRLSDPDRDVRAAAVWALGMLRSRAATQALIKAVDDPDEYVGRRAVYALGRLGHPGATNRLLQLINPRTNLANDACRALGKIKDEHAIPVLVRALGVDHSRGFGSEGIGLTALGDNAAEALVQIGRAAGPQLIPCLSNSDEWVRERAAATLARINYAAAAPTLLRLLNDENAGWIRANAAVALGELKETEAIPTLMQWLNHDKKQFRLSAIDALGRIGDGRSFDAIARLTESNDDDIRRAAIDAIAGFKDNRAFELLARLISNADVPRSDAIMAIAAQKHPRAVDRLVAMLNDPAEKLWNVVTQALRKLGDGRAVQPLIEAGRRRPDRNLFFLEEAAHLPGALDALIPLLRTEKQERLEEVIYSLKSTADRRAIEPLRSLFADPHRRIRSNARSAVWEIEFDTRPVTD